MPVARGVVTPLVPMVFQPRVNQATLWSGLTQLDGNVTQFQVFQSQYHKDDNAALGAFNGGDKWDIDSPDNGGGKVSIRSSGTEMYLGSSELVDGATIEAVSTVHATLYTIAYAAKDYNGTFNRWITLCVDNTSLVWSMENDTMSTFHVTSGEDWKGVHRMRLRNRIFNPEAPGYENQVFGITY